MSIFSALKLARDTIHDTISDCVTFCERGRWKNDCIASSVYDGTINNSGSRVAIPHGPLRQTKHLDGVQSDMGDILEVEYLG